MKRLRARATAAKNAGFGRQGLMWLSAMETGTPI